MVDLPVSELDAVIETEFDDKEGKNQFINVIF